MKVHVRTATFNSPDCYIDVKGVTTGGGGGSQHLISLTGLTSWAVFWGIERGIVGSNH